MRAVYPGSFDPVTIGHLGIIRRSIHLGFELTVLVGSNIKKESLFSLEERLLLIENALLEANLFCKIIPFHGLLADYVKTHKIQTIIRGLRAVSDFEYEFQMAHINQKLSPKTDTIFFPTHLEEGFVSSSSVKEIASLGGDLSAFVPPSVAKALKKRFSSKA